MRAGVPELGRTTEDVADDSEFRERKFGTKRQFRLVKKYLKKNPKNCETRRNFPCEERGGRKPLETSEKLDFCCENKSLASEEGGKFVVVKLALSVIMRDQNFH